MYVNTDLNIHSQFAVTLTGGYGGKVVLAETIVHTDDEDTAMSVGYDLADQLLKCGQLNHIPTISIERL